MVFEDSEGILDIKAVIGAGIQVDIEIQLNDFPEIMSRILLYWSRLYSSQIQAGDDYHVLKKTISILIMDYIALPKENVHRFF